jgi:hypothetical protein
LKILLPLREIYVKCLTKMGIMQPRNESFRYRRFVRQKNQRHGNRFLRIHDGGCRKTDVGKPVEKPLFVISNAIATCCWKQAILFSLLLMTKIVALDTVGGWSSYPTYVTWPEGSLPRGARRCVCIIYEHGPRNAANNSELNCTRMHLPLQEFS